VTTSTTYLATAPGAYFGAGKDDTDGDLADGSWRWSKDPSANVILFGVKAAGSWSDPIQFSAAGVETPSVIVTGEKVVGTQGAAVADVGGATAFIGGDAVDLSLLDATITEIKAQLNALLAELRAATGHGLIA